MWFQSISSASLQFLGELVQGVLQNPEVRVHIFPCCRGTPEVDKPWGRNSNILRWASSWDTLSHPIGSAQGLLLYPWPQLWSCLLSQCQEIRSLKSGSIKTEPVSIYRQDKLRWKSIQLKTILHTVLGSCIQVNIRGMSVNGTWGMPGSSIFIHSGNPHFSPNNTGNIPKW